MVVVLLSSVIKEDREATSSFGDIGGSFNSTISSGSDRITVNLRPANVILPSMRSLIKFHSTVSFSDSSANFCSLTNSVS